MAAGIEDLNGRTCVNYGAQGVKPLHWRAGRISIAVGYALVAIGSLEIFLYSISRSGDPRSESYYLIFAAAYFVVGWSWWLWVGPASEDLPSARTVKALLGFGIASLLMAVGLVMYTQDLGSLGWSGALKLGTTLQAAGTFVVGIGFFVVAVAQRGIVSHQRSDARAG